MGRALIEGLQALRGVAKTTAVGAFAEVGRFSRFDNARQLMAYTGLNMPELFEFA